MGKNYILRHPRTSTQKNLMFFKTKPNLSCFKVRKRSNNKLLKLVMIHKKEVLKMLEFKKFSCSKR